MVEVKTDEKVWPCSSRCIPPETPYLFYHPILVRRTAPGSRCRAMKIRVKLFAALCRYFGDAVPGVPFEVELPEGSTMADLVSQLNLPREEVKVFFVNGRARPAEWPLEPGDEVGIFPLIAGG